MQILPQGRCPISAEPGVSLLDRGCHAARAVPTVEVFSYDDRIARWFVHATSLWGFIGMSVGALIALQLPFWPANLGEYLSFGRLRPLHSQRRDRLSRAGGVF